MLNNLILLMKYLYLAYMNNCNGEDQLHNFFTIYLS